MILTQDPKDNDGEAGTYEVLRWDVVGDTPSNGGMSRVAAYCKFVNTGTGEMYFRILLLDTTEGVGGRAVVDWGGYVQLVNPLLYSYQVYPENLYEDIVSGVIPLAHMDLNYIWLTLEIGETLDESADSRFEWPQIGDVLLVDYQGLRNDPDQVTILDFFDAETPEGSSIGSPYCRVALCQWKKWNESVGNSINLICGFELEYGIGGRIVSSGSSVVYLSLLTPDQFDRIKNDGSVPQFSLIYKARKAEPIAEDVEPERKPHRVYPERAMVRNNHYYCPCQMGLKGKHRKVQRFSFAKPSLGISGRLAGWEFGTVQGVQTHYGCQNCGRVVEAEYPYNVVGRIW